MVYGNWVYVTVYTKELIKVLCKSYINGKNNGPVLNDLTYYCFSGISYCVQCMFSKNSLKVFIFRQLSYLQCLCPCKTPIADERKVIFKDKFHLKHTRKFFFKQMLYL